MLQANPSLTPNLVKAILQFTAESRDGYNALTQGRFLNTRGAVDSRGRGSSLPRGSRRAAPPTLSGPDAWSRHIIWGNHRIGGGQLRAAANAWRNDVDVGQRLTPEGHSSGARRRTTGGDDSRPVRPTPSAADHIVWGHRPAPERQRRLGHRVRRRELPQHRLGHRLRAG
jgi:hypothetical protein